MRIYVAVLCSEHETPTIEVFTDRDQAQSCIDSFLRTLMGVSQPPTVEEWGRQLNESVAAWAGQQVVHAHVEEFDMPITVYSVTEQIEWGLACTFYSDKKTALDDVTRTREKWLNQHPQIEDWKDEQDREHVWDQLRTDLDQIVMVDLVKGELR